MGSRARGVSRTETSSASMPGRSSTGGTPTPPSPSRPARGQGNPPISEGLCLAIEPMVNVGRPETRTLGDQWTVVTADKALSAHFEHTLACTAAGPVVLTAPKEGAAVAA